MAKFNERLRELRNSRGISQQLFADKIGISKSSINMYERGEREPGIDSLIVIADFFDVDMDYLTGRTDQTFKVVMLLSHNELMSLGNYIKQYREKNGLSQRQFAAKCGISNGYVSMLEAGVNPSTGKPIIPKLQQLYAISKGMSISIAQLCKILTIYSGVEQ